MNTWHIIDGALMMFGPGGIMYADPIFDYRNGGERFVSGSILLSAEKKEFNRVKATPEEIFEILRTV